MDSEHFRQLFLFEKYDGKEKQEAECRITAYYRGWIYCSRYVLYTTVLNEINIEQMVLNWSVMMLQCDNISAITTLKKLVQHSTTKHINSCHHFIWEPVEKILLLLNMLRLKLNVPKTLDTQKYIYLRSIIGVCIIE